MSKTPDFPIAIRKRNTKHQVADASLKSKKRNNTFSESRDLREDRGMREIKTLHNSQTFFRICALL
jgi:hypothetical protein